MAASLGIAAIRVSRLDAFFALASVFLAAAVLPKSEPALPQPRRVSGSPVFAFVLALCLLPIGYLVVASSCFRSCSGKHDAGLECGGVRPRRETQGARADVVQLGGIFDLALRARPEGVDGWPAEKPYTARRSWRRTSTSTSAPRTRGAMPTPSRPTTSGSRNSCRSRVSCSSTDGIACVKGTYLFCYPGSRTCGTAISRVQRVTGCFRNCDRTPRYSNHPAGPNRNVRIRHGTTNR